MARKFRPTIIPPPTGLPDHLVIDSIQLRGLALKGNGIIVQVKTVWLDSSGAVVGPGPARDIMGSAAAYLRDPAAWDRLEETILEELQNLGLLEGSIE